MANIANLAVQLTANTAGFTGGLVKAESSLARFNRQTTSGLSSVNKAFAGLPAFAGGFIGIGSAAAVATVGITKIVDAFSRLDELGDNAQKLGTTADVLSGLNFAATMMDAESFSGSIEKLSINLGKAFYEAGPARDALHALGVSARGLTGLPLDEQLLAVADGFADIESQSEKSRLAVALFGKGGLDMLNMMEGGSDAIKEMIAEGERIGAIVTQEDVDRIGDADAAMKRLKASTEGLANVVAIQLAPAVAGLTDAVTNAMTGDKSWGARLFDAIPGMAGIGLGGRIFMDAAGLSAPGKAEAATRESTKQRSTSSGAPDIPEDMKNEAERLAEAMRTPIEEYAAQMERLRELFDAGAIDKSTFSRAQKSYAEKRDEEKTKKAEEQQKRIDTILAQAMTPFDDYIVGVQELNDLFNAGKLYPAQYSKALQHLQETFEQADPATRERTKQRQQMESDAANLVEQTRTPMERYNAELGRVKQFFDAGLIDSTTANRAAFASDQQNLQPMRERYINDYFDAMDAQASELERRRDLLANTGEFRQVTNTSRLALGGTGISDPQVRMLDVQTKQLSFLREIALQTRQQYAVAG